MQSKATTVEQYLAELPEDRRAAIRAVREVILRNLDTKGPDGKGGYVEGVCYGMIGYSVPHSIYPAGYHCDPTKGLPFAGLASQKGHMSLYLTGLYSGGAEPATPSSRLANFAHDAAVEYAHWFHQAWAATGKKLDMGKACIRFKRLEDLPLEVIGEAIKRVPVKTFIAFYENAMMANKEAAAERKAARGGGTRTSTVKPAKKKVAKKVAGKVSKKAAGVGRKTAKKAKARGRR